jgi:hypothetical protein
MDTLDGLQSLATITSLDLVGHGLRNIGALAGRNELEVLRLRSPVLTDIAPLAKLRKLRSVDLTDCRKLADLSPLAGLRLDRLTLTRTRANRSSIPATLHPAVSSPSLVAPRRRPRGAGLAIPAPPPETARPTFAKVRKQLLVRDAEQMRYGIELLRALDDAALYEAFLSGCTITASPTATKYAFRRRWWLRGDAVRDLPTSYDVVVPNRLLRTALPSPYRDAVIRALVAYAPAGCQTGARLREAMQSLVVNAHGPGMFEYQPIDVAPLARLPNLEHLGLLNADGFVGGSALALAPNLRSLVIEGRVLDGTDLGSPTVQTLVALGTIKNLNLDAFPNVRSLQVLGRIEPDKVRGHLPRLSNVHVDGEAVALLGNLARSPLTKLTAVSYKGSGALFGAPRAHGAVDRPRDP